MQRFALYASIVVTFSRVAAFAAEPTEVSNGGFEDVGRRGLPSGWHTWRGGGYAVDDDVAHSGRRSARVRIGPHTSIEDTPFPPGWSRYGRYVQHLVVEPETVYTAAGWIKAELQAGVAGIAFQQRDHLGRNPKVLGGLMGGGFIEFFPVVRTTDWVQVARTFKTPPECRGLLLMPCARGLDGTVWFDDVTFERGAERLIVPTVPSAPKIDDPADGAWDRALTCFGFIQRYSRPPKPAQEQTIARLLTDGRGLHLLVECVEPDMAKRKTETTTHDGAVYDDDSIEIFIDANRDRSSYYQLVINAQGAVFDAAGSDRNWDSHERVATWDGEGRWWVGLSIPFTSLGYGPVEASTPQKAMAINICRSRRGAGSEVSSWAPLSGLSFHTVSDYIAVDVGGDAPGRAVSMLYRLADPAAGRLPKAWQTQNPLYGELMTDELLHPRDAKALSCVSRVYVGSQAVPFALQHGFAYDAEAMLRRLAKLRLAYPGGAYPAGGVDPKRQSKTHLALKRHDLALQVQTYLSWGGAGYAYGPKRAAIPTCSRRQLFIDPRARANVVKWLTDMAAAHQDDIWAYEVGHEDISTEIGHFFEFAKAYQDANDPRWGQWDAELRQATGGKFGMPDGPDCSAAHRVAFFRWYYGKRNAGLLELSRAVRDVAPDIELHSEQHPNGLFPMQYSRQADAHDVFCAAQILPALGPDRQHVAFAVKLLHDLTGKPTWGGLHLEHYFASHTPEEANELVSQVFRVGGSGCKFWLIDWFGITGWDLFGARSRFEEIMNCLDHLGSMRKLRFPAADSAIFFSNDSEYTRRWAGREPNQGYEAAFTFIGPRARGWFRFVSDCQIEDHRVDLTTFRIIYVPWAPYASDAVAKALNEYASNGGTVVYGDQSTMAHKPDGTPRGEPTAPPGPWRMGEVALRSLDRGLTLAPLRTDYRAIAAGDDGDVLLTYADGAPAAVRWRRGRGRVVAFAQSPFTYGTTRDRGWQRFFAALHRSAGAKLGHDIWRFRFPRSARAQAIAYGDPFPERPQGTVCLTGNCARWRLDAPVLGPNAKPVGWVRYSRPPDGLGESAGGDTVAFAKSDLMDRVPSLHAKPIHHLRFQGTRAEREAQRRQASGEWVLSFASKDAVHIDLDFGRPVEVSQVALWLGGETPALALSRVGRDGTVTRLAGCDEPRVLEDEVLAVRLNVAPATVTRLRIGFGPRRERELVVAELEVWGQEAQP